MFALLNISKKYNDTVLYEDFNLTLQANRVNVLLGPSGCGKSTLLNILSGLVSPDSGELVGFDSKDISYLFQEPRLLPWKTVLENIVYVLNGNKQSKIKIAKDVLIKVGLENSLNLFPHEISGGMARRVAIARAFAFKSKLLILDEPFASLDMNLKLSLISLFKGLWEKDKRTVLCVTHDLIAARELGERIITLTDKPVKVEDTVNNLDKIAF